MFSLKRYFPSGRAGDRMGLKHNLSLEWLLPPPGCPQRTCRFVAPLAAAAFLTFLGASTRAAEFIAPSTRPDVAEASDEGETAIKRFRVPGGFKVDLFAAEPLLANPVAFCIDEKGRFYVAETFRHSEGVLDIRGVM